MFYELENGKETQLTDDEMADVLINYYSYNVNGLLFAKNAIDDMMILGTSRTINGAIYQWRPE
jgi:hypothetical protein